MLHSLQLRTLRAPVSESMLKTPSEKLEHRVTETLRKYQREVDAETVFERQIELAAELFSKRNRATNPTFREIRRTLAKMCCGAIRCMYCEDSRADEVEHHRPKNLYPSEAFVWENYLYACGTCNAPKNNGSRSSIHAVFSSI